MPAAAGNGRRDHLASLGVVGAALVDGSDLINAVCVAGGDQHLITVVVGGDQALGSSQGAEVGAGLEFVAVHGVIGL